MRLFRPLVGLDGTQAFAQIQFVFYEDHSIDYVENRLQSWNIVTEFFHLTEGSDLVEFKLGMF